MIASSFSSLVFSLPYVSTFLNSLKRLADKIGLTKTKYFDIEKLPEDTQAHILTFLGKRDLQAWNCVSKSSESIVRLACQTLCKREGFILANLPIRSDYEKTLHDLFLKSIGPECYREYFGEVEVVPVPSNFIDRAQAGFKLVYIPEYITIEVDENSPLMLDQTTAINGKSARLVKNDAAKGTRRSIVRP